MNARNLKKIVLFPLLCGAIGLVGCGKSNNDNSNNKSTSAPQSGKGPAAGLHCTSSGKNAFDTYGLNAFVAVNKSIFKNVGAELAANGTANLGDSFSKVGTGNPPSTQDNAAAFEGNLAAFLVYVYGGPDRITYVDGKDYQGVQDMADSHKGLNITSSQYDYFVANIIVPALQSNGVPAQDIATCFAPPLLDPNFKASIVGH